MHKSKLYVAIVVAMLIWSFSFIWTRMAILSFKPVSLITLRLVIAVVLLFFTNYFSGKFQKIKKQDIKWFFLLAFFEPYMYYMGETYGLTKVSATLASVVISTIPLFAPLLAYFLIKERISKTNILGIIVSISGVFVVIYRPQSGLEANPAGISLLFVAVISSVVYTAILRKIPSEYNIFNIVFYQSLLGLFFFLPTYFFTDFQQSTSHQTILLKSILALILLAVLASVVAFLLFAWVVRKIGVAKTNVFVNLIPVFTTFFSYLLLDEKVTIIQCVGIIIVICGLFISQIQLPFVKKNSLSKNY